MLNRLILDNNCAKCVMNTICPFWHEYIKEKGGRIIAPFILIGHIQKVPEVIIVGGR